jgi:hypothetical protein
MKAFQRQIKRFEKKLFSLKCNLGVEPISRGIIDLCTTCKSISVLSIHCQATARSSIPKPI